MPTFEWKGSRAGQMQSGVLNADSKEAANEILRRQRIEAPSIREKGKEIAFPKFGGGVPPQLVAIFTRQFSVMIDAGLPLVQCLEILAGQQENKTFKRALIQIRQDVESGSNLADSMRKHPKIFNDLFTNMVAAGEAGGILDTILQRLAQYIEKSVKLNSQVKSAMIYPVAVISIACIVVAIILWKVIPVFAALFKGLGAELPMPTQIVIWLSNFIADFWWLIAIVIGGTIYALRRYHETYKGKRVLDGIILKMPILGILMRKIAVARFCRTLSTLTSSGVPILDGLQITARTAGNSIIEDAIMATRKSVEEGKTISEPLSDTDVFPTMVVQMIAVGEQTGALDTMLSKIADFYEDEVDTAVAGLMKLLEPVLIAFLGVAIGGIVIAMYMPMFTLIGQIG
ncbi:MAG: type II secretion system F family protein [Acidobacteria bacterium]|nr:type II secretion system F family protein [Acidobacteriota bacterium]MBV9069659.1 type II secretion system F family protein [Acidobacteriota bacterium]MBV9185305.1 type II secretion system F family protein [Acidobacteriota bacterium]